MSEFASGMLAMNIHLLTLLSFLLNKKKAMKWKESGLPMILQASS